MATLPPGPRAESAREGPDITGGRRRGQGDGQADVPRGQAIVFPGSRRYNGRRCRDCGLAEFGAPSPNCRCVPAMKFQAARRSMIDSQLRPNKVTDQPLLDAMAVI